MEDYQELVFVYGTLRQGASNHWRIQDAECLGTGLVRGGLYVIDWYPGLVLDPSGSRVAGEVYRVSPDLLEELDAFEGAAGTPGSEYHRVRTDVTSPDGERREHVWVWEFRMPVEESRRIVSGDWIDREQL